MLEIWRARVKALKREVAAIAYAARDPRTPWTARLLIVGIVAYAVSPIDLIPDFIPVLGYLDELLLLPAALLLAAKLIPPEVMSEARTKAAGQQLTPNRLAAVVIVGIWLLLAAALICLAQPSLARLI